jgi:hypothetical protein
MNTVLREGSLASLFAGGLVGPVAACLCIVGFWHVRQNIVPRGPLLGRLVFYALAAMMVAGHRQTVIEGSVFAHVFAALHSMRIIGAPNESGLQRVTHNCVILRQEFARP